MIAYLDTLPTEKRAPFFRSELIFPLNRLHNHGSSVAELANGDLLAVWYRGSGERGADDVQILGARLPRGSHQWSEPFIAADTPGFPDTNPCLGIDPLGGLWLFYVTILDNHWESALLKYRYSREHRSSGSPRWSREGVIHLKPGPEFEERVKRDLELQWAPYRNPATADKRAKLDAYIAEKLAMSGNKLSVRLGWMTRVHPFFPGGKRIILPLYSDGFDFSMMALSDDGGLTWHVSHPLVGPGNVQPSIVRRKNKALTAFFRDNGPAPQRVMRSDSYDEGATWSLVQDIDRPDPGAGLELLCLRSGRWLLVNNNTEEGRHRLALSVSDDEGATWPIVRYLEHDEQLPGAGSYSYPSVIQAKDGSIHVTYSYNLNQDTRKSLGDGEAIKHAHFNESWLLSSVNASANG